MRFALAPVVGWVAGWVIVWTVGSTALAGQTDGAVGGRAEVSGGIAPQRTGDGSGPLVSFELVPIAGVAHRTHRDSFQLVASPRVFARQPNVLDLDRPLFLGRLDLTHGHQVTRRLQWSGSASGVFGELDYTAIRQVFGDDQTTVLPSNVLTYGAGEVSQGASIALARRHILSAFATGSYGTYLGTDDADPMTVALPTTISAQVGIGYTALVTRRDQLTWSMSTAWSSFDPGLAVLSATGRLTWSRQLSPDSTLTVGAGAFVPVFSENTRQGPSSVNTPPPAVIPDGEIAVSGTLHQTGRSRLTGRLRLSALPRTDGIRGALYPLLGAGASLRVELPPHWSVGILANFATPATESPDVLARPGQPDDNQTVLSGAIPVQYKISRDMAVDFGVRGAIRMSHLADTEFGTSLPELLFYVAFRGVHAKLGDGLTWTR